MPLINFSSLKKLQRYLLDEIPVLNKKEKAYLAIGTGLFIFLFMVFFQPFGVNNYDPTEKIRPSFILAVGAMSTFLILGFAISEFIIYPIFIRVPTRLAMILWTFWSILWISFCAFLIYNYLGEWHDWYFKSYLEFILNIGALLIIPITAILIYIRMRELRATLQMAYSYAKDDGEQLLVLTAENQKDQFTIPMKLLVFVESDDNYISIHHLKNDQLSKTLFRKSLKSVQEDVNHPALIRCHRSYMVNLMHVEQLQGNRNKLEIHLTNVKESIPVSRQYIDDVYKLVEK